MINVRYNFIPNVSQIYNLCKNKIPLYKVEDHPGHQDNKTTDSWPGTRSLDLAESEPFFYLNLMDLIKNKFNIVYSNYVSIDAFVHLRLKNDDHKDWIHTDQTDTILIYLSPTNLLSGTSFFSDDEQEISNVKFVQNSAVYFDGQIRHKSISNYGDNIDDGRMTINIFCHKK
jgi:hypothetical protein